MDRRFLWGITAAGTAPDSHRIPLHRGHSGPQLPCFGCKVIHFFNNASVFSQIISIAPHFFIAPRLSLRKKRHVVLITKRHIFQLGTKHTKGAKAFTIAPLKNV